MPYSNTITALDFGNGVGDVRVTAGYHWHVAGVGEQTSDEVTLDVPANSFLSSNGATFSYGGNLAPQPRADWYIGLWIEEIPRIASNTGWLFRSGQYTTEPPTDPIEVILAPEQFINEAKLAEAIGPLPMTSGSTTITGLTLTINGKDVDIVATGTDTGLPAGDTFRYTATLVLIPSASKAALDTPFEIRLDNQSVGFIAGVGTGFSTALLNLISGIILSEVSPRLKATVRGIVNAGVLSSVATRVNRGVPTSMPPGVVLSIRNHRATTQALAGGGTESVIGVLGALGAYGGVLNKFPALTSGRGCFVATAAVGPDAPELVVLREWRDSWLRNQRGGTIFIRGYERLSPRLAHFIARSDRRRALARQLIVTPAVRLARRLLLEAHAFGSSPDNMAAQERRTLVDRSVTPKTIPKRRCQMKLSEFERSGRGARTRFVTRVTDLASEEEFELTIAGPGALVTRMFRDADIKLTIDSNRTQDQVLAEFDAPAQDQQRKLMWELAGLKDTRALLKPAPEPPDPKSTVFAAVRPVVGTGTPFAFAVTGFFVPKGVSFFFTGSFVFTTVASLRPTSGDQDLFLHLFSPTGTTVSSSILGGTSLDVVWFSFPFFPYVPVFEVKGFTAGVCGVFAAHGA